MSDIPGDDIIPPHYDILLAVHRANTQWIMQEYGHMMRFIVTVSFRNGKEGPVQLGIFDAFRDVFITLEELLEYLPVDQRKLDPGC